MQPASKLRAIFQKFKEQHSAKSLGGIAFTYDGRSVLIAAAELPFASEGSSFEVEFEPATEKRKANLFTIILKKVATRRLSDLAGFFSGVSCSGVSGAPLPEACRVEIVYSEEDISVH